MTQFMGGGQGWITVKKGFPIMGLIFRRTGKALPVPRRACQVLDGCSDAPGLRRYVWRHHGRFNQVIMLHFPILFVCITKITEQSSIDPADVKVKMFVIRSPYNRAYFAQDTAGEMNN